MYTAERLLVCTGEVRESLDFTLNSQKSDGWLGPEPGPGDRRLTWPRYLFLLGAIVCSTAEYTRALQSYLRLAICRSGPYSVRSDYGFDP